MFQNGTYPYEFIDGPEKFKLGELPPREKFYSILTEETVSEEDYARAQQVWTEFHILNMKEYHDMYLSLDVLLLADVFENFRKMGMEYYGLDALHYYTLPGFTLDACLKKTKQSLKLLMSPEHLLFFESSIKDGISVESSTCKGKYIQWYRTTTPMTSIHSSYTRMLITFMALSCRHFWLLLTLDFSQKTR